MSQKVGLITIVHRVRCSRKVAYNVFGLGEVAEPKS